MRRDRLPSTRALAAVLVGAAALGVAAPAAAQDVLFDFDTAPMYTALPIDLTVGGVTAHLSATGQGYSIQSTSSAPVVPVGFSGRFVYPSSVFAADLVVSFSRQLTAFSILYAPQELGCDDSATMRVTATMNGVLVGTATKTASQPGTYPAETLACSFPQGFDKVVVHYDKKPPLCTDWGPIFLADNMLVTLADTSAWTDAGAGLAGTNGVPNLIGAGTLSGGSPGALILTKARASAFCMLAVSMASTPVPFKGGVLVAFPALLLVPFTTQADGALPVNFTWQAGVPTGTQVWFQFLVSDLVAVQKVAQSNAVKGTTP